MIDHLEFYPFHAINEFMRPDFKLSIIREVLTNQESLPDEPSSELTNAIRSNVKIPGFRNSDKAPALIKIMPTVKYFEKNPELVKAVLSAWGALHNDLLSQVYELLKNRKWTILDEQQGNPLTSLSSEIIEKWPILPPEFNRTKAPGFLPRWPIGEDFQSLYTTYTELFPDGVASIDQVSLMAVWLTLRLPYTLEDTST